MNYTHPWKCGLQCAVSTWTATTASKPSSPWPQTLSSTVLKYRLRVPTNKCPAPLWSQSLTNAGTLCTQLQEMQEVFQLLLGCLASFLFQGKRCPTMEDEDDWTFLHYTLSLDIYSIIPLAHWKPYKTQGKKNHTFVAMEILGSSVQERHGACRAGPAESYKTDQGIGESLLW